MWPILLRNLLATWVICGFWDWLPGCKNSAVRGKHWDHIRISLSFATNQNNMYELLTHTDTHWEQECSLKCCIWNCLYQVPVLVSHEGGWACATHLGCRNNFRFDR